MSQADGYVRIVTTNDTEEAQRSTEQLSDTIANAMDTAPVDQMGQAFDDINDSINNTGEAAVTTGALIKANLISDVIMQGVQQLGEALKDTVMNTVEVADGLDSSVKRIGAATNATAAEMQSLKNVVEDIYSDNFGDGFDDIADSVSKIKQNLGELDDAELVNVTESAYALQELFDAGVDQSSRAARAIMHNFEVSAAVAYDYMARGAQNGLDYSEELLDTISEYSVQFRKLGFTLDDMFNIMTAGAENGAWKLDTVGDLIKELSITAIDGADSTREGFELLGLNADEMSAKFAAGSESAKQAFEETISAIAAMEDPIKQDAAGVALMKTMWEDLGKDAVLALDGITNSAYEASGAMDDIKELNYSSLSDSVDTMKRKIDLLIQPIGESLVPSIKQVADAVTEAAEAGDVKEIAQDVGEFTSGVLTFLLKNVKLIGSAIAGATAGVVAFKAANTITKVISSWQSAALQVTLLSNAQGAAAVKTAAHNGALTAQELIYAVLSGKLDIATAKQYALNTAMSLNPAGIIAISIGVLATALTGFALSADNAAEETKEFSDTLDEIKQNQKETIAQNEAELALLEKKVARYEELRNQTSKNAEEIAELSYLAEDLQNVFGDTVTVVDSLTGSYNSLTTAYEDYAATLRRNVLVKAKENSALIAQEEILKLEEEYSKLEEKRQQYLSENEKYDRPQSEPSDDEASEAYIEDDDGNRIYVYEDEINDIESEQRRLKQDIAVAQKIIDDFVNSADDYSVKVPDSVSISVSPHTDETSPANYLPDYHKANAEDFKYWRDLYKYDYDMGLMSADEYYQQLAALADEYLEWDCNAIYPAFIHRKLVANKAISAEICRSQFQLRYKSEYSVQLQLQDQSERSEQLFRHSAWLFT